MYIIYYILYIHTYIHTYIYVYVYVYVYMYMYMYVCVCTHIYICIKIHFFWGGSQKFMRSRGLEGLGKRLGEEMVEAHHQGLHPFPLADLVGLAYDPN